MFEETLPSSLGVWALTAEKVQWPLAGRVPCDWNFVLSYPWVSKFNWD